MQSSEQVNRKELKLMLLYGYGEKGTEAVRLMWASGVPFIPQWISLYEEVYPEHRGRPVLENRKGKWVSGKIVARGLEEIRRYMDQVVQGESGKWFHREIGEGEETEED